MQSKQRKYMTTTSDDVSPFHGSWALVDRLCCQRTGRTRWDEGTSLGLSLQSPAPPRRPGSPSVAWTICRPGWQNHISPPHLTNENHTLHCQFSAAKKQTLLKQCGIIIAFIRNLFLSFLCSNHNEENMLKTVV